ncbi:4-carboxymuconolactone decarboxylase [Paraburkholderia youngii]
MARTSPGSNRSRTNDTVARGRWLKRMPSPAAAGAVTILIPACAHMQRSEMMQEPSSLTDLKSVSPALEHYTTDTVLNGLWKRPQLSPRDRSIVTLSVLIARNQTVEMPFYSRLALDNGVKPAEISEIITHLAFYSGWANATATPAIVKPIFDERGIGVDQLPRADVALLPLNEVAEKQRAQTVEENFGAVAPGVVQYTTDVLFRDLWLRPGLAPRDRSLVTVSALVANGQVAQIPYHLNRAMDNGLTRDEASEMLTQLAFYAGWPNVFSALPVFKDVISKRATS